MLNKLYCNLEIAKLAKKAGFNEPTQSLIYYDKSDRSWGIIHELDDNYYVYDLENNYHGEFIEEIDNADDLEFYLSPTLGDLMTWLSIIQVSEEYVKFSFEGAIKLALEEIIK